LEESDREKTSLYISFFRFRYAKLLKPQKLVFIAEIATTYVFRYLKKSKRRTLINGLALIKM